MQVIDISTPEKVCATCALVIANGDTGDAENWNEQQFNNTCADYEMVIASFEPEPFASATCFACDDYLSGIRYDIEATPR